MTGKVKRRPEFTILMDTEIRRLQIKRAYAWAGVLDACDCRYPIPTTRDLIAAWERLDEQIKVLEEWAGFARSMMSPLVIPYLAFQPTTDKCGRLQEVAA